MVQKYTATEISINKRMNLPQNYWSVEFDKIPESLKKYISKYLEQIDLNMREGVGMILTGTPGVGKTGAAAYLAKYIRGLWSTKTKQYNSVLFIRASDLREKFKTKEQFDEEHLFIEQATNVDFLVIDDLMEEDLNASWPGPKMFVDLLASRTSNLKSTVITTNIDKKDFIAKIPDILKTLTGFVVIIQVTGENQRLQKQVELNKRMGL